MRIDSVKNYLAYAVSNPFFLFVGDDNYTVVQNELSALGFSNVPVSSFCRQDDKLPDTDELLTYLQVADAHEKGSKFVITGLGEFLALRGTNEAKRILSQIKDMNVGTAKIVLLLRGITALLAEFNSDPRFDERRFCVINRAECDMSLTVAAPAVGLPALSGIKALLEELEKGQCGNIIVNTAVNLDQAIFSVHKIITAYDAVKFLVHDFSLVRSCGNDEQWGDLLKELGQHHCSWSQVFGLHRFDIYIGFDFYERIARADYNSWLYFLYLKINSEALSNSYLKFVLEQTDRFDIFLSNILNAIMQVPHTDQRYPVYYRERKALIANYPESEIAEFVINSRQIISDSVCRLTDGTMVEREEIIAWLSQYGVLPQLKDIYPLLATYLKQYVFKCPDLAEQLTEYFEAYKRQKLSNVLEQDFLAKVDMLALTREYNRLPTRNEVLDKIDKSETFLYWLDALGVEYLSLIEDLALKHKLSIKVHIARAELPTITSINRDFFDVWDGSKSKTNDLDDIKHNDSGGYSFSTNALPIHLAKELDIIKSVIEKATIELTRRRYKRYLIVSDHGASRLAVLRRKEEKYETDTSGEHSGRCCKLFEPYELPFAAEENGYLVLADYGRFKGSRAANVEVHGGASWEEVVIPVIELSLQHNNINVTLVDDIVSVDFRTGTAITLFANVPLQDVAVVLNGKRYPGVQSDENHYIFELPDIKRAGDYPADVFAGDDLVGKIVVKAQGKSGKVNDAFDDLF